MFAEYEAGRTPNPDILCNREIKFDVFLDAAKKLGADFVATGHYCKKGQAASGEYQLIAGEDDNKDQSYFLCQLTQEQLSMALFPIGHLQKSEVRKIAAEQDLITADKKDSQGLCFIGKVKLPTFLQQKLKPIEGNVIELDANLPIYQSYQTITNGGDYKALAAPFIYTPEMGTVIGQHQGAHYFTIGQRKGLAIGGKTEPLFVIGTDTITNTIYTGQGSEHPGLNRMALFIENDDIHWIRNDFKLSIGSIEPYKVRIRYRQDLMDAELHREENGLYILFKTPVSGISPGQFAAWYKNDELIGSGVISH